MLNRRLKIMALLTIMLGVCRLFAEPINGEFKTVASFSHGDKPGQLVWNATLSGGVPDGSFQGPMAFLTDKNGNFWIGDTLNARIVGVGPDGKPQKEIDLLAAGKALKLASDVVLLDLVPGRHGRILVADAANNVVIELDVRGKAEPRCFRSAPEGKGHWQQINRIHSDKYGRIYIEDLPSMRTLVLSADGEPMQTLEGELSLAVNPDGQVAMLVMDTQDLNSRHVVISPVHGRPVEKAASIMSAKPVMWAAALGFYQGKQLCVIHDTEDFRYFSFFNGKHSLEKTVKTKFVDPGYDPCRPEWIGLDGRVYMAKIASGSLDILELKY